MNREAIFLTVKKIKPFNVKKYLQYKGWVEITGILRKDIFVFENPDKKEQQIIFPNDDDYENYTNDILIAINHLQKYEQRDITSIITQLINPEVDILRYRLKSKEAESGSVSLNIINKFINGVANSLRAAICDCLNTTAAHHTRLSNKKVSQILEQSQFGQTEHGSFVVKVITPLQPRSIQDRSSYDSLARQGIKHLLKSTETIVQTVNKNSVQSFLNSFRQSDPPFSDNLVNSLVDMQIWDDATLELSSEWSPAIPVEDNVPQSVTIMPEYFKDIELIGCSIAPAKSESATEYFTGFVTELCGDTNVDGQKYGLVHVAVTTQDQDNFTVDVNLEVQDHATAIQAYEKNMPVSFSGNLVRRSARIREVSEVKNFKLCY
jgi:hypothetical protein